MDDAEKPEPTGASDEPSGVKRLSGWLFEQRPPRGEPATAGDEPAPAEPAPALRPAPIAVALDAADQAPAAPEPPAEPESPTDVQSNAEPESPAEPEQADPEPGPVQDPDLKARPRPYAGAPLVFEPAVPADAAPPVPGDAFFTRPDDDVPEMWRDRKPKDKTATKEKPAAKADKPSKATDKEQRRGAPKLVRSLLRLLVVVAVAVVAALLLRTYVVEPYYVPSQSMEPTLHGCPGCNNDHVLVEKLSYHFHDVKPGDVVVFHRPSTWRAVTDPVLIKRVIGVAGDKLVVRGGKVYRNGQQLDEPYVNKDCKRGTTNKEGSQRATSYIVPKNSLFVMGDNRCDSEDSRFEGAIPTDKVIGRAFLIIWPVSRIHSL